MTKFYNTLIFIGLLGFFAQAQNDQWQNHLQKLAPGWYQVKPDAGISSEELLRLYREHYNLASELQFELKESSQDEMGFTHQRYRQLYRQVPVEGAQALVHAKGGRLKIFHENSAKNIQMVVEPGLSPQDALEAAKNYLGAERYAWEEEVGQKKFPPAFHEAFQKPEAQLVILDPKFRFKPENFQLAWKLDVFATQPMSRQFVYVDAHSGEVLLSIDRIHHHSPDTGVAVTSYHGIRPIIADSVQSNQFLLRDSITGGGVYTFNMQQGTMYTNAVDFTDNDNFWNNFNPERDEVATDAHWGTEVTYDYFFDNFGRQSYDDQNSALLSFVHYDSNYVNAFWNGSFMTYGDGNGSSFLPLTALDVVGHEIAHGVTQNSAGLIYFTESGALNESFSDIFGSSIEFTYDSLDGDWLIGEEFTTNQPGFRSMSDPNANGDPDTYFGLFWGYGIFIDNGYVHSNSGVQNHWYYLLTEGGSDVNDLGAQYSVNGIGLQKAQAIAYRNLTTYLTPTSDHFDARIGSLLSAQDLFGSCSKEEIQCANAWYAVGVGPPVNENDLVLTSVDLPQVSCDFTANENIRVKVLNNSCSFSIPTGDTLSFKYVINNSDSATEELVLNQPLPPGDSLIFSFQSTADLSQDTLYSIDVMVFYDGDSLPFNNEILDYQVLNRVQQNTDLALLEVVSPLSSCDLSASTPLEVRVLFNGCDSIARGSTIDFVYRLNGGAFQTASYSLNRSYSFGESFVASLPVTLNAGQRGSYRLDVALSNPADPNAANDSIPGYEFFKPFDIVGERVSFESIAYADSFLIKRGPLTSLRQWIQSTHGNFGLLISGGNTLDYPGGVDLPVAGTVWRVNAEFNTQLCACVDATSYTSLFANFDLKQHFSRLYDQALRTDYPFASPFRLTVNGTQISPTYIPLTYDQDNFTTYAVDLSAFAGSSFELCFEARPLTSQVFNTVSRDGDESYLDNIRILENSVSRPEWESSQAEFTVYPNPGSGSFSLLVPGDITGSLQIQLLDLGGKMLYRSEAEVVNAEAEVNLKAAPGVYLLRVQQGHDFQAVRKLIIH